MTTVKAFVERLAKVGVKVELAVNYPWVYLDKVNGKQVTNNFYSEHGFTIFFLRRSGGVFILDIAGIFKEIRKHL